MTICQFKRKEFISLSQKYEERYVNFPSLELHYFKATLCTAWKVSVLWVFLVRIFTHSDWIRRVSLCILSEGEKILTRKTSNMDTFYAVISFYLFRYLWQTSVNIWTRNIIFVFVFVFFSFLFLFTSYNSTNTNKK